MERDTPPTFVTGACLPISDFIRTSSESYVSLNYSLISSYICPSVLLFQSSLGTLDLGQVYYEPLKDRQGNVLLVTLKDLPNAPR